MSSLKPEQVTELKDAFSLFDRNGDGNITVQEMEDVLKSIGVDVPNEAEVLSAVKSQSQGGLLDFGSFLSVMGKALRDDSGVGNVEDLEEAFRAFDKDNNDHLSVADLKKILCSGSQAKLKESDVDEILKDANVDADGDFNYKELATKIMKL